MRRSDGKELNPYENHDGNGNGNGNGNDYWTKYLMNSTMAMHVRYKSWFIFLPSSAK